MSYLKIKNSVDYEKAIPIDRYKKYDNEYWLEVEEIRDSISNSIENDLNNNNNYSNSISRASILA